MLTHEIAGRCGRTHRTHVTAFQKLVIGCLAFGMYLLLCGSRAALGASPLPDNRGWEMVSPVEKNGGEINGINGVIPNEGPPEGGVIQATEDGSSITYLSLLAFPGSGGEEPLGAPLASQYLATRTAGGWTTDNITAPMNSKTYSPAGSGAPYRAFSPDLSQALMLSGGTPPVENPPLTEDAPARYINYYLRDDRTGLFSALLTSAPAETPSEFFMELVGVTPDLKHLILETGAALSPEATRHNEGNLYEWTNGHFEPINVAPEAAHLGETAEGGAELGNGFNEGHAVSDDGSRVFWRQPSSRELFVREHIGTPQATTVQVDKSQGGPDTGKVGEFRTASVDGSRAFFTDRRRLTPDSTAGGDGSHQDLYMFETASGRLTDITVDNTDLGGAAVQGVLGANSDGSTVYFVATGQVSGTAAVPGMNNLYMWHDGQVKYISTLSSQDDNNGSNREPTVAHDWNKFTGLRTARVSPNGQHVLFMSAASLTGYNNHDANNPEVLDEEVYLYDAESNRVTCLSCNPSGARPSGGSGFSGGTPWRTVAEEGTYQSRVLSSDSNRVFFDSRDALVPQDRNGSQDVYEWERSGTGGCRQAPGCIYLLSGGLNVGDSAFVDASTSGNDAFFVTRASLVPQDMDELRDLYDARVGGGFPQTNEAQPACEEEGCLPAPSPASSLGSLVSMSFEGAGNAIPPAQPAAKTTTKTSGKRTAKTKRRKKRTRKKGRKSSAGRMRNSIGGAR